MVTLKPQLGGWFGEFWVLETTLDLVEMYNMNMQIQSAQNLQITIFQIDKGTLFWNVNI